MTASGASRPLVGRLVARCGVLAVWLATVVVGLHASPPAALAQTFPRPTSAPISTIRPVDGDDWQGRVVAANESGEFVFENAKGERKNLAAADLVRYGHPSDASVTASRALIVLRDGGRLMGRLESLSRDSLELASQWLGLVTVPRNEVAAIVFQGSNDPALLASFVQDLLAGEAKADRISLDNGDRLDGTIVAASYPMDGDQAARLPTLTVEVGGAKVSLSGDNLRALRFADARRPAATPAKYWVGFRDGTLVAASKLLVVAGSPEVTWRGSRAPWSVLRREGIVYVQPLGGRTTYLSDLEPQRYRHVPFLSLERPYFADRNALGLPLRSGGKMYAKGLGMFPAAALTYSLPAGEYKRFDADLVVDDAAGRNGSATFQVLLDGKPHATAPTLRGGEPPVHFSVDVSGVKTLTLLVVFADHGDALDYADWLDARLVKSAQ